MRDEARHAEFFERVVAKLGPAEEASTDLALLKAELLRTTDYDELSNSWADHRNGGARVVRR